MARWEADASARLQEAALALFAERGLEGTTVAAIAERAGVTERTFFRHFADKREVLFAGGEPLFDLLRTTVAEAPADAAPIDAVRAAVVAMSAALHGRRAVAAGRQAVIDSHPDLRERERTKLAAFVEVLAAALRDRGVREPAASLAAESGIVAFRVAWTRWIDGGCRRRLDALVDATFDQMRATVG